MKGALKENINARDIDGLGFVQANLIFSKLDEIITHDKITTNQSTGEREDHILHLVEDRISFEDNITIALKEERDNDYCGTIREPRNPFLLAMTQASITCDRMAQQAKKQKLTVGLHHVKLNPLISTWEFPKGLTMINLMNTWLMGNRKENIPPLQYHNKTHVEHIENGPNNL